MCKHVLNAQVQVFTPCCRKFFDCPECHGDDHPMVRKFELELVCKKCKKAFRVDTRDPEYDESDEYCPHCDNHYVLAAKTPQAVLKVESEDTRIDARMLKDDRIKGEPLRTIFNVKDAPDRLG